MQLKDTLRYELPPEGITLLGYVVRRMQKTHWLVPVRQLLSADDTAMALAHVATYAVAASTSFGRAYYQPKFNTAGDEISEADPATGALIAAKLETTSPCFLISYSVKLPDGSSLEGSERITGTTVGLRGVGMPAPSEWLFRCGEYSAKLTGTLTSELVLSLIGRTRIRAHGLLNLADSAANTGKVSVDRSAKLRIGVNGQDIDLETDTGIPGP